MQVGTRNRPENPFLCVVADRYPNHSYCNKSFPTIEKHNEHLKRCHSFDFWCSKCLHKFNCSLPAGPLRLARKEHDEKLCPGKPSRETQQVRDNTWLMTPEQYRRFKDRRWKKTRVPDSIPKESVPETSWRRIRENIFPGSEAAAMRKKSEHAASRQTSKDIWGMQDVMDKVGNRQSIVLPQLLFDVPVPGVDTTQLAWPNTVPPSLPTEESQMSTVFSEETDYETHPSSRVWSHAGGDEQYQSHLVDLERHLTLDPSLLHVPEEREGHQASESMTSLGVGEDNPVPQELLWFCGSSHT